MGISDYVFARVEISEGVSVDFCYGDLCEWKALKGKRGRRKSEMVLHDGERSSINFLVRICEEKAGKHQSLGKAKQ